MSNESNIDVFELARTYNGYQLAWKRILATLVDFIAFIILGRLLVIMLEAFNIPFPDPVVFLLFAVYSIGTEAYRGWTLGKRLLGLRVVHESGALPTLWQAIFRFLSKLLILFPPIGIYSFFRIINSAYHQRTGDAMTHTFVVRRKDLIPSLMPLSTAVPEIEPIEIGMADEPEMRYEIIELLDDVKTRKRFMRSARIGQIFMLIAALFVLFDILAGAKELSVTLIAFAVAIGFYLVSHYAIRGRRWAHIMIAISVLLFFIGGIAGAIMQIGKDPSINNYGMLLFSALLLVLLACFPIAGWKEAIRRSGQFTTYDRYGRIGRIQNFFRKSRLYLSDQSPLRIAKSLGLLLISLLAIFFMFFLATIVFMVAASHAISPDYERPTAFQFVVPAFLIFLFINFRLLGRVKRILKASAAKLRKYDNRLPILYIRSFKDDPIKITKGGLLPNLYRTTLEEMLDHHLSIYGPVIAIGQPGDKLPPLGAARHYVTAGENWQERVENYIQEAKLIVTVLSHTPGLNWEYRKVAELGALSKMIIVIPPLRERELHHRWETLFAYFPSLRNLSEYVDGDFSKIMALRFTDQGQCRLITFSESVDGLREDYFGEKEYRLGLTCLNRS